MKITVNRVACIGSGQCALTAPEVFDQDDADGRVLVLDPAPAAHRDRSVREAAAACPVHAISLTEVADPAG